MFLALGFLVASLLWLLAAPAFWSRAVRLTTQRLRDTLPVTEAEIRADKDRIRAEYALRIHHQQVDLEDTKLASARQVIELNRRDARINGLEAEVETLKASLEGAVNARSVLEQTVAERLPRVEERLIEAKSHLSDRDQAIADLTRTSERQSRALQEANAINEQLKREVQTLTTALETAGARERTGAADSRVDSFVALRAELDALRTRTREQSALIDRLQKAYAETIGPSGQPAAKLNGAKSAAQRSDKAANASDDTEKQLRAARELAASREQEIARLKASVAVYEKASKGDEAAPESRIALKASLSALEAKSSQQEATVAALRSEVAGLQEQLTRAAADHAAEISRLGNGTIPAAGSEQEPIPLHGAPRGRRAIPRLTLAERVAQSRRDTPEGEDAAEPTPLKAEAVTDGKPRDERVVDEAATSETEPQASGSERRTPRIKSRLLDRISDLSKA
jgi:chromosome segregation ATPase